MSQVTILYFTYITVRKVKQISCKGYPALVKTGFKIAMYNLTTLVSVLTQHNKFMACRQYSMKNPTYKTWSTAELFIWVTYQ